VYEPSLLQVYIMPLFLTAFKFIRFHYLRHIRDTQYPCLGGILYYPHISNQSFCHRAIKTSSRKHVILQLRSLFRSTRQWHRLFLPSLHLSSHGRRRRRLSVSDLHISRRRLWRGPSTTWLLLPSMHFWRQWRLWRRRWSSARLSLSGLHFRPRRRLWRRLRLPGIPRHSRPSAGRLHERHELGTVGTRGTSTSSTAITTTTNAAPAGD
jgi:hypothetical protein